MTTRVEQGYSHRGHRHRPGKPKPKPYRKLARFPVFVEKVRPLCVAMAIAGRFTIDGPRGSRALPGALDEFYVVKWEMAPAI